MESSAPAPSSFAQYLHEARFQYSDCLDDRQIRLLELRFGHSDEIVCLDIQTFSIDNLPPYIALSYTWGDLNDTVNVCCDGKTLAVTRNLQEALWQFRENRKRLVRLELSKMSRSQLLHFWVDAICIDQECNKEKSFQVGMMANIYQQARHVFTWLGPADKSSDVATCCINTIGKMAEDCGLDHGADECHQLWHEMAFVPGANERLFSTEAVIVETVDGYRDAGFCKAAKDLFDTISRWDSENNLLPIADLTKFFTRPWWTRIWVLQEITLSRDTYFICGTQRLPRTRYDAFINMYNALRAIIVTAYHRDRTSLKEYHRDMILHEYFHRRPLILLSMPRIYRQRECPLIALLRTTSIGRMYETGGGPATENFGSTKPEDKIFALLGLASDRDELKRCGVVPNYDIPYQQTYAITMAALLKQGHIFLLSMCRAPRSPDLPSWVPDWSRPMNDTLQEPQGDPVPVSPAFRCSGHRVFRNSTIKAHNDSGTVRRISIKSYLYDEVYQVGCFAHRGDQNESLLSQLGSWPVDWLLEILRLSYRIRKDYKGFHNRLRASARTCIGDIGWDIHGDKERVGNTRCSDAVLLLSQGLQRIEQGRFRFEAHRFLTSQTVQSAFKDMRGDEVRLVKDIMRRCLGRIPFVTRKGHIGISSQHIMQGDAIAIIEGGQVPFVFRQQDEGHFSLISEAYVHGIMDGEVANTGEYSYVTLV